MSEEQINGSGYGYQDDNATAAPSFSFGLNPGAARLIRFEWIPNGGKDGAEQEALEIKFQVGEKEVSYRKFPVTRAFDKDGNQITDPKAPEIQAAKAEFSAVVVHILHCFVSTEQIKQAFGQDITSFKHYCQIAANLLPSGFQDKPLDIFFQYQPTLKAPNKVTFLELPQNMKQGKWLTPAQSPAPGISWKEVKVPGADKNETGLYYMAVDANANPIKVVEPNKGEVVKTHIITRSGWFMSSNFAKQQKDPNQDTSNTGATSGGNPPASAPTPAGTASDWN